MVLPCRYGPDKWGVKYILENWTRQHKLGSLPIFAMGVSAGASFVLKLPKVTRINGIVSGRFRFGQQLIWPALVI